MKILFALVGVIVLAGCAGMEGVVTKAEYDQVQTGMTYAQVSAIVGDPGEQSVKSEMAGFVTESWTWENSNGSNMICMFQNGAMITKAQAGLG